jgi:hypothetical protein
MSKFEEVYQEEIVYYWSEELVTDSINKLKEAYYEDIEYQREVLRRNIETGISVINALNLEVLRLTNIIQQYEN